MLFHFTVCVPSVFITVPRGVGEISGGRCELSSLGASTSSGLFTIVSQCPARAWETLKNSDRMRRDGLQWEGKRTEIELGEDL